MKKVLGMLVYTTLALGVLGGVLGYSYSNRFLPGTTINGTDVSNLDLDTAKDLSNREFSNSYYLNIKFIDNVSERINGSDIDLSLDFSNNEVVPQGILSYINGKAQMNFDAGYKYNEDKLREKVKSLKEFDEELMIKPVDAYIADYDGTDYKIVPETKGDMLYIDKACDKIVQAVDKLDEEVSLIDCYKEAEVKQQDLVENRDKLNNMLKASITYTFDDGSKVIINKDRINNWLDKDTATVREDRVRKFLDTIRDQYDTQYKNQAFVTTRGSLIRVSGPYGYVLTKDDECAELIKNINEGVTITREPIWIRKGNDLINKSYIEVSLKEQHVWMYVNGELVVETDCVTGTDSSADRRTTPGIYPITYKQSPATLKGAGYSSDVSYWMPFNMGQGLHDATWRSSFGGNIYKTSGSHGCVNLPLDKAKIIYEHAWKGMPVVVY